MQRLVSFFRSRPAKAIARQKKKSRTLFVETLEHRNLMAVFLVSNTDDIGSGSLRQAIESANNDLTSDVIQFNIPGSGVKTITVATELPGIFTPMTIDGWSQPGFTSQPLIKLQGATGVQYGLNIYSTESTIRGLIINSFDNTQLAIWGGDQNKIQGNYFGTNNTATALEGGPSNFDAVFIGNGFDGSVGNIIGVDGDGVNDTRERNVVGGGQSGIGIWGGSSTANRIAGNYIGTNAARANLGNAYAGIWLDDGANQNVIGSNNDGFGDSLEGNIVSFNGTNGIVINGAATERNRISRNLVSDNVLAEIDLGNDGHDINDNLDVDTGPNRRTNVPDLTSLTVGPSSFVIGGKFAAEASKTYRLEFFATSVADSSGYGGSRKYLGFTTISTNSSGQVTFSRPINNTFNYGWMVSATATDPNGNTSEFSSAIWDGYNLDQTFSLNSNPSATKTIYLDFNGQTTVNTQWNIDRNVATIVTPVFSLDADPAFSAADLLRIQSIYQRVVEDFRPFNVNVTTQEPPLSDLIKENVSDQRWGIRAAIGGSWTDWYGVPAGGVGYNDSFNWDSDTPVFSFSLNNNNNGAALVADNISHEVGHSLGLHHDGESSNEYYFGHGTGETSWNSIMGGGSSANLTQWSKGEYLNSSNAEDDLSIITTQNGFGYVADDFGNTTVTAAALSNTNGQGKILQTGLISTTTDRDYFYFETAGGLIDLTIGVAQQGPNLDILARVLNGSGAVVLTRNPAETLSARLTTTLTAGRYYISIDGTGKGTPLTIANGYTDYASLGFYSITGVINGLNLAPLLAGIAASQDYTNNNIAGVPIAPAASVTDTDSPNFLGGVLTVSITGGADSSNRFYLGASPFTRSGINILLGSVLIGRLNSQAGIGLKSLIVTFTQDATADLARQFIQALRFKTIGNVNSSARQIAIKLTDGDGGTSNTLTTSINIV